MKKLLIVFCLLCFSLLVVGQSTTEKKQVRTLSKYSVRFNKNTKDKLSEGEAVRYDSQSFNFHYSQYLKSSEVNKDYNSLLLAYNLNPTYSELYFELAKYYELKGDKLKKKEFCNKLKKSNLTPSLREYAYNTLMSVEQNGILVTYGENDTYPLWILQNIENIRTDVKILNYNLLMNRGYRDQVKNKLGLRFSKSYSTNVTILKDVAVKNRRKPIYYSLTISHIVLKELKGNLYSTGLALKYSRTTFDNSEILKINWENKFSKKYISNPSISLTSKQMNLNYVLPLIQLSNYYKNNNRESEHNYITTIIKQLGKNGGKEKQIQTLLMKQQ